MKRFQALVRGKPEERDASGLSFSDYLMLLQQQWNVGGNVYPTYTYPVSGGTGESIDSSFPSYVHGIYKANGVVFACMAARQYLFSEVRFQYRRFQNGRPTELFGDSSLALLENPWPNGTTGELLARMEQDVSMAGNFYATVRSQRGRPVIKRMRPDWVTIVMGSQSDPNVDGDDLDAELIGYSYQPGGPASKREPIFLLPGDVCHFSPSPDPLATYRGMSWLTPVLREIEGDQAATEHKLQYFRHAATPNLVVTLDKDITKNAFDQFKDSMEKEHRGLANAYKTLYLGGGADVTVVGNSMEQVSFKVTQGAGETRIAAASLVPSVIIGLSEGLSAATYSNFGQARRLTADKFLRPSWRMAAASLQTLVTPPTAAQLWYDARDVAFLQEDEKDRVDIQQVEATTIKQLIDAGFQPDDVVAAVKAGDLSLLAGKHTGLFSVQLQPPGTQLTPSTNGRSDRIEIITEPRPLPAPVVEEWTMPALRVGDEAQAALEKLQEAQQLAAELDLGRSLKRFVVERDEDDFITTIEELIEPAEPEADRLAREVDRLRREVAEARANRRQIVHHDDDGYITEIEDVYAPQ